MLYLGRALLRLGSCRGARWAAERSLRRAPELDASWKYGNMLHHAQLILGRVAVRQGDVAKASEHLLEAAHVPPSPQLRSFGPNMALAKELLELGETSVVLEYLTLCERFWELGHPRLEEWKAALREGKTPAFGPNLLY